MTCAIESSRASLVAIHLLVQIGAQMPIPVLKATAAHAETFAGVTYHIEGELVPMLHLELSGMPVYFEH
jgi:hypothetical protein